MAVRVRTAIAVIPARFGSQRLPGKPLLRETGKPLIQHVVERARLARSVSRVLVATDDERIVSAVRSFGGEAVLTRPDHPSGTDRIAEAVRGIDAERIVNVQGDEPEIEPSLIDRVVAELDSAEMSTAAVPFADPEEAARPDRVKVVLDRTGFALYFSRARIPHAVNGTSARPLLHLGIYGYTRECLLRLTALAPSSLERSEKLEQLRALEHGVRIRVAVVEGRSPGGIDTQEDYDAFVQRSRTS